VKAIGRWKLIQYAGHPYFFFYFSRRVSAQGAVVQMTAIPSGYPAELPDFVVGAGAEAISALAAVNEGEDEKYARYVPGFDTETNGLRAALQLRTRTGQEYGYPLGQPIDVLFHVQNVSDHDIYLPDDLVGSFTMNDQKGVQLLSPNRWNFNLVGQPGNRPLKPNETAVLSSSDGIAFYAAGADPSSTLQLNSIAKYVEYVKPGMYNLFPSVSSTEVAKPAGPLEWRGKLKLDSQGILLSEAKNDSLTRPIAAAPVSDPSPVPVTNSLQATLELDSHDSSGYVLGQPIDVVFYLRNVSDRPVRIAGNRILNIKPKIVDEQGNVLICDGGSSSFPFTSQRKVLLANSALPRRGFGIEFVREDQDKPFQPDFRGYYVHARPGRYRLSYQLKYPEESVANGLFEPSDWRGALETAPVTIEVRDAGVVQPAVPLAAKPGANYSFGATAHNLQAALALSLEYKRGFFQGEPLQMDLVIRNTADSQMSAYSKRSEPTVTDEQGQKLAVRLARRSNHLPGNNPYTCNPTPNAIEFCGSFTLRFLANDADAPRDAEPLDSYYVIAKPGKYIVSCATEISPTVPTYAPAIAKTPEPPGARPSWKLETAPITVVVRESSPPPQATSAIEQKPSSATAIGEQRRGPQAPSKTPVTIQAENGKVVIETSNQRLETKRIELNPVDGTLPAAEVKEAPPADSKAEPTDKKASENEVKPSVGRDVSAITKPRLQFRVEAAEDASEAESLNFNRDVIRVSTDVLLDESAIASAILNEPTPPDGWPSIGIRFTEAGAKKISEITAANLLRRLVVLFDGRVLMAPKILSSIGAEAQLTGRFKEGELKAIVDAVQAAKTSSDEPPFDTSPAK
jgi:hypothetical protein